MAFAPGPPLAAFRPRLLGAALTSVTTWAKFSTGTGAADPIITPNAGAAPDGTMTATRVQLQRGALGGGAGNNSYSLIRLNIVGPTPAQPVTDSVYLRCASGSVAVGIRLASTGPADASNPAGAVVTDARAIANVTTSWKRFSVTGMTFPGGQTFDIILWTSMPETALTADILAWNPQADLGTSPAGSNRSGISPLGWGLLGLGAIALLSGNGSSR
jgi:hypothetical protein